jgi:hypothetical protein
MKRLISANASDIAKMSASELKQSIKASEGRTILSENIAIIPTTVLDITSAEIAKGFGADLILINMVDVFKPAVWGLESQDDFARQLKNLTGAPVGINLEPVDTEAEMLESKLDVSNGRLATVESLKKIEELGMDFVCFTGNPGTGVTNNAIMEAVKMTKEHFSGLIIAGKMHGSGVNEPVADVDNIKELIEAGADIILVPSIGTIPGFDHDQLKQAVKVAHEHGALVMSAIGTSQEGAKAETIRYMAIQNKICGVDIQHIGDGGYAGLAPALNILEMSQAIRGIRHTLSRMGRSINR